MVAYGEPVSRDAGVTVLSLLLLITVKVPSSLMVPVSFCATGASFTPVTVIVKVAVAVSELSVASYVKTSVSVSPASKASAAV